LQQLLLKQIPTCFELKFRAYSLLSRCYQLVGTIAAVKQTLKKGLELSINTATGYEGIDLPTFYREGVVDLYFILARLEWQLWFNS
jgi:hypothetical protein